MQTTNTIHVTFRQRTNNGIIRRAIPCASTQEAQERAAALARTNQYLNVAVNNCGRLPKGVRILTPKQNPTT